MSDVKVTVARVTSCKVDIGSINAPLESVLDVITKLLDGDAIVTIRCTGDERKIADGLSQLDLVSKDWNGQSHVYRAGRYYDDKLKKFRDKLIENSDHVLATDELDSAFEGMTNGEVIKTLFPEIDTHDFGITVHATERVTCCGDKHCRGSISYDFWKEWWNAPYKAESEE